MGRILEKTIKGLPTGFRVVFELRDVQGLSTEDTAEALGLSVPAVKSRLLRARLQLRERLSRYFRRGKSRRQSAAKEPSDAKVPSDEKDPSAEKEPSAVKVMRAEQ
jgi:RNA polymerase sigma-70 factor (ECF subfamily)